MKKILIVLSLLFTLNVQAKSLKDTSWCAFVNIFVPQYFQNYQIGISQRSQHLPRLQWMYSLNYYYVPGNEAVQYRNSIPNSSSMASLIKMSDFNADITLAIGVNYDLLHYHRFKLAGGLHLLLGRYSSSFTEEKITDTGSVYSGSSWQYNYENDYSAGLVIAVNPELLAQYRISNNVSIGVGFNVFNRFQFGREHILKYNTNTNLGWDKEFTLWKDATTYGTRSSKPFRGSRYDRLEDAGIFLRLTARI